MTDYNRTYIPPVFHLQNADDTQIEFMQNIFETLQNCAVDYCVVVRADDEDDALVVMSYGDFSLDEKGEILKEIVNMYKDKGINHISME